MADDKKIIFSMVGVSKVIPPQRQILKNIYLSFFYGAKIGIIGLNGSGKSTLMKIIAGIDKSYQGEVVFSPGYSVGYLEQDPKLDPEKTVKEVVQEGLQPILDLLAEFDSVNAAFCDPEVLENPDKMESLINRQAELQELYNRMEQYYREGQQHMEKASQEKMGAISEKLKAAIKEVGVAGGYVYIMDVAAGVPYISETLSVDVTETVKAKLGIK